MPRRKTISIALYVLAAYVITPTVHTATPNQTNGIARLATLEPGPHTLYVNWQPSHDSAAFITVSGVTITTTVSNAWQPIAFPENVSFSWPQPIYWETTRPALPVFKLISCTTPLSFEIKNGLVHWNSHREPDAKKHSQACFILPPHTTNYLIHLHKIPDALNDQRLWIGTNDILANPYTTEKPFVFKLDDQDRHMQAETSADCVCSVDFRPLLGRNDPILPHQPGLYFFHVVSQDSLAHHTIARNLFKGHPWTIDRDDLWLSSYAGYLPVRNIYPCDMLNSPLFTFTGFHDRERAPNNRSGFQRWTAESNATLKLIYPPTHRATLAIRLENHHPPTANATQPSVITIMGQTYPVDFKDKQWEGQLDIPGNREHGQEDEITIEIVSPEWKPSDHLASRDQRTLGILLTDLQLIPLPDERD